jgi:hypothetical protein
MTVFTCTSIIFLVSSLVMSISVTPIYGLPVPSPSPSPSPSYNNSNNTVRGPANAFVTGTEICDDGEDNDGDGLTDESACIVVEICDNGIDDNHNGVTDESSCTITIEICLNNVDDDGDGFTDEAVCISAGQLQSGELKASDESTQPSQEALDAAADKVNPPWQSCPASTDLGGEKSPSILTGLKEATYTIEGTAQLNKVVSSSGSTTFIVKVKSNFNNGGVSGKLSSNNNNDDSDSVSFDISFLHTKCEFSSPVPGTAVVTAPKKSFSQSQFFLINPPFRGCDKTSYKGAEYKISGKTSIDSTGLDSRQDVKIKLDVSFTTGQYSGTIVIDDNSKNKQNLPFSIDDVSTSCLDTSLDT